MLEVPENTRLSHRKSQALMADDSTESAHYWASGSTRTRARAADIVLGHWAKAIEIEEIEERVSELERAAELAKK